MQQGSVLLGEERWQAMWQTLGAERPPQNLRQQLLDAYSEFHRSYHTLQHLGECLVGLEQLRDLAERPAEIELALWFHDAVYDPKRKDNEQRSADWASEAVLGADLAPVVAERIVAMVMATRHQSLPVTTDEKILIDIDLAILGASPERFAEYEQQIGREYHWVAEAQRIVTRGRILQSFLDRECVYSSAPFKTLLEQRARQNLRASIAALGACP